MSTIRILVINPNSSRSITAGLEENLESQVPAGVHLLYYTGPSETCPPSINDATIAIQSAQGCYSDLSIQRKDVLQEADAVLVCCFSDHPLVNMLRHQFPQRPCMHILESAISAALSSSSRPFAILTTGSDMVSDIDRGVLSYMGGLSMRYAGCIATDLGVLELRDPASQEKVHKVMGEKIDTIALKGIGAVILGCAGMAGMESFIRQCLARSLGKEAAARIAIIDGAKAGVQLLVGLHHCSLFS